MNSRIEKAGAGWAPEEEVSDLRKRNAAQEFHESMSFLRRLLNVLLRRR